MKKKITLKQIAKELDVSISTVSKALKNSKEISEDTRVKIQEYAKLYNYRPNNIALSLKNRKTRNIAVIIPEIVHHFFAEVIAGIERVANARGYHVMVALSNESFDKEVINIETLVNGSIDGFILSVSKETSQLKDYHHLDETISQGVPIVMFDRVVDDIVCDKVIVDDREGARNAVGLLIRKGCDKVMLITTKDFISVGKLRSEGYALALDENGIGYNEELVVKASNPYTKNSGYQELEEEIEKVLQRNANVDAVFAVNESYALAAMKVARRLGRKMPEDFKVVAFSDGPLSRHAHPSLTTVDQHGEKIGEEAANLLIDKLDGLVDEETYVTEVIKTTLVERESTL